MQFWTALEYRFSRFWQHRRTRTGRSGLPAILTGLLLLSACASIDTPSEPVTAQTPPASAAESVGQKPASAAVPAASATKPESRRPPAQASAARGSTPPPRQGGAYFQNDGPGDNPPTNLDAIPNAKPRQEALLSWANRPYTIFGRQYVPSREIKPYRQRGVASWYGRKFHGNKTAIGERYDMYAMTAAHPTLPIPSYAKVTNTRTGQSVVVRVNDRGPFLKNRLIDLSYSAAHRLGYLDTGFTEVEVEQVTADFNDAPNATATLASASQGNGRTSAGNPQAVNVAASTANGLNAHTSTSTNTSSSPAATLAANPAASLAAIKAAETTSKPADSTVRQQTPAAMNSVATAVLPGTTKVSTTDNRISATTPLAVNDQTSTGAANRNLTLAGTRQAVKGSLEQSMTETSANIEIRKPAAEQESEPVIRRQASSTAVYVQLGAFQNRENARWMLSHLDEHFEQLGGQLEIHEQNGWFKVQAGPFNRRADALALREHIREATDFTPFLTTRATGNLRSNDTVMAPAKVVPPESPVRSQTPEQSQTQSNRLGKNSVTMPLPDNERTGRALATNAAGSPEIRPRLASEESPSDPSI